MTIIFSDGFESGDFTAWTSTSISSLCSLTAQQSIKHTGQYAAEAIVEDSTAYKQAVAKQTVSLTEGYLRGYLYVKSHGLNKSSDRFNFLSLYGTDGSAAAGWTYSDNPSNARWYLQVRDAGGNYRTAYYQISCNLERWYCVEIHYKKDATTGIAQLFVDGQLACELTGYDFSGAITEARAGINEKNASAEPYFAVDLVVDDIVVADTYIGPIDYEITGNLTVDGNASIAGSLSAADSISTNNLSANTLDALSGNNIDVACTLSFGNNSFTITNTNTIINLNSDLLDSQHGSYYRDASNLNAGTVGTARLGSGTADNTTYLRGDSTWATLPPQQWTAGVVSNVTSPLQTSSNTLSIPQASSSQNGYLSSTDWNTFYNKYGPYSSPNFANVFCTGATSTNYFSTTGNADISGALTVNKIMQSQCNAPTLDNSQLMAHLQVGNGGGRGYASAPTVTISGGNPETAAEAVADINPTYGTITSIRIISPGSGFKSTPAIYISESPLEKKTASAMAILGKDNSTPPNVIVKQIILTGAGAGQGGGYGYNTVPSVTIDGAGSGAYATAVIDQTYERVTRINVTSGGSGYSPGTTTVTIAEPNDLSIALSDRRLATAYAVVENGSVVSIFLTGELPQGQSTQRFLDTTGGQYYHQSYSELFLVTNPDEYDAEGVPHNHVPILATNDSFLVKKDFQAGGLIASQQGALFLNYGFKGKPVLSSPPAIYLGSSKIPYPSGTTFPNEHETSQLFNLTAGCTWGGTYYPAAQYMWNGDYWGNIDLSGYYDTLFLFKDDGITPGNMVVGALTVWGKLDMANPDVPLIGWQLILKGREGASSMRSASSLNASINEAPEDPQLIIDSPNASIRFSDDCNLYRVVKDEVVALETDNGFIAPAIDANQLVINQDAYIVGSLALGTALAAITFTTGYTISEGTTIRYLMPDADKTVGLGSQGTEPRSFAFVNTDRLYVNEIRRLSDGALWNPTILKKGTAVTDANGEAIVNFDAPFTATPVVTVTPQDAAGGSYSVAIKAKSTTSFTVKITKINGDHKHYTGQAAATASWTMGIDSQGNHNHSFSPGAHTHKIGTAFPTEGWTMGVGSGGSHSHTVVGTTGVGSSHSHSLNSHTHVINMAETSRTTGSSSGHTHSYGDYYSSSPTQGASGSTGSESGHNHNYSGYSGNHDGHGHDLTNKPPYARQLSLRNSGGTAVDCGALLHTSSQGQIDLYTESGTGGGGTTGDAGNHSHNLTNKAPLSRGINMRDASGNVIDFGATMCTSAAGSAQDMYTLNTNVVANASGITFDWMAA